MTRENKDEEIVEPAPESKPKLALIIISVLTGVLLAGAIGATIYYFQAGKALRAELAAAKKEAKRKTLMINELQEQIAGLSKQIHALKEFSVAKANEAAAEAIAAAGKEQPPPADGNPSTAPAAATATAAPPPAAKKPKPAGLDCQLVGKSAEEQIATLQRCTKAMDGRK